MNKYFTIIIFLIILLAFSSVKYNFRKIHELGNNGNVILFNVQDFCKLDKEKLILTDKSGFRLVVCDTTLTVLRYFGERGNKVGKFKGPSQIAINEKYIVVSDFTSSRIQLFNKELKPIKEFYTDGPVFDLAFDKSGNLLVGAYTGSKNTLLKYNSSYNTYKIIALKNLKGDMFNDIYKINVLPDGKFVIAYLTQNKLEIHEADGKYLNTITINDLQAQPNYLVEKNIKIPEGIIIGSITSDSSSNIWVLAGHYSIAPKQEVFIYSLEGKLLRKILLPRQVEDFFIDGKFMYTIESNRTLITKYLIGNNLK